MERVKYRKRKSLASADCFSKFPGKVFRELGLSFTFRCSVLLKLFRDFIKEHLFCSHKPRAASLVIQECISGRQKHLGN